MNISTLDLGIILVYLLAVLGFGYFVGRKEGVEDYFVNSRKTKLWLLVFTSLSTSVGAGSVIGVASAAYDTGISFGISFLILSAFGWFLIGYLAPKIKAWSDENNAYTLGDFFISRYSGRTRRIASLVILLSYFAATAVQFVAFARLVEIATNIDFYIALLFTAVLTIAYTVFAGIKGDFYTDAIQFFVMMPVFVFLLIKGFSLLTFNELFTNLPADYLNVYNYSGPAFFYAAVLLGFPLILVSMEVWQRVFAAVDAKTARTAFYLSGLLKVVVISVSIIIGLMAFHLVPGTEKDSALFTLMIQTLPRGLIGLGFAGILAILMSTVDSMIMVGSATLTKDFYLVKYPDTDNEKLLKVGRISSLLFGFGGLLIAFFIPDIVRLSVTSAQIVLIFAPALIGGLLWQRVDDKAAYWSILIGTILTLIALPFMPDLAFLPGFLVSFLVFFYFVYRNKNSDKLQSNQPMIG